MNEMKSTSTWRYMLHPVPVGRDDTTVQEALNGLGNLGWELIAVYESAGSRIFVFKQPNSN